MDEGVSVACEAYLDWELWIRRHPLMIEWSRKGKGIRSNDWMNEYESIDT